MSAAIERMESVQKGALSVMIMSAKDLVIVWGKNDNSLVL